VAFAVKKFSTIIGICLLPVAVAIAADKPRVVVSDVQTWNRSSEVSTVAFEWLLRRHWFKTWGCERAKEMISALGSECAQVQWVTDLQNADYALVFDDREDNKSRSLNCSGT
jgi:hypothetical protein